MATKRKTTVRQHRSEHKTTHDTNLKTVQSKQQKKPQQNSIHLRQKKINALKTYGENITITTEAAVYARNKEQRVQQKPHNTATKHHTVLQQNNASVANYKKNH